jgi:hypothetical protein
MIFATSGGVKSTPVFVLVAQPAPGALIVSDAQVLSVMPPRDVTPGEVPPVGTAYEVRLSGITTPPSPGTAVLASGNAPVAGKVLTTRSEAGALVVTLALAPLHELLAQYNIDWRIDLSALSAVELPPMGAAAKVRRGGIIPGQPLAAAGDPIKEFKNLSCDVDLSAKLASLQIDLKLARENFLDVQARPGYSKHVVVGETKVEGTVAANLKANVTVKGECIAQALIKIPIGGLLSLAFMPGIRVGVGVALTGSVAVTAMEVGLKGEVGARVEMGWECHVATAACVSVDRVVPLDRLTPKLEINNPIDGFRVELKAEVYALLGLEAVFGTFWTAGIVEARMGPVASSELAFEKDQVIQPNYASKYDLKVEGVIEPGPGLKEALKHFTGTDIVGVTFQQKRTRTISESPKGVVSVGRPEVGLSDPPVEIRVTLSSTDYFPIGYNVRQVDLWRKSANVKAFEDWTYWKTLNVNQSGNQSVFTTLWQATADDVGMNEFAAVVQTNLLPQLGVEVADNSVQSVDVRCFSSAPRVAAGALANANVCSPTWQGTATFFQPGVIQIETAATWTREPEDNPSLINYIATGVAQVKWIDYETRGCTVSQTVFPFSNVGLLTVEYTDDPPSYSLVSLIPLVVDVTCDGATSKAAHVLLWVAGSGRLSGNKTQIIGRNDLGDGSYFSWSFKLP